MLDVTTPMNRIYIGQAVEGLIQMKKDGITANTCVTSPPYFGLRDYGAQGQIGLEKSPEEYIQNLVAVFSRVRDVLADDGTLWVNIGDSYASSGGGRDREKHGKGSKLQGGTKNEDNGSGLRHKPSGDYKAKDLIGIPWMLAFALRADGWYLRQDIIWSKPNPMPESVTDRCTKSHEYIFMLSKKPKYYYDSEAIKTPSKNPEDDLRRLAAQHSGLKSNATESVNGLRPRKDKQRGHSRRHAGFNERWDSMTKEEQCSVGANKRSVWDVATKPYKGAHFAVFPEELITPCILAGCPPGGIVLDPFMGSGTTAITAIQNGMGFAGCELNPSFVPLQKNRLGLFAGNTEWV